MPSHNIASRDCSRVSASYRLREGMLGALLGDALGVPHEFKPGHLIPPSETLELFMPESYKKSHAAIPYGTWSDDGSQLLCLLEALHHRQGTLEPRLLAGLLQAWLYKGRHQAGGRVFDCGGQTRMALECWRQGLAVEVHSRGQGNGSLMRTLPAAFIPWLWGGSQEEAVTVAVAQSCVTHPHPVAAATCAVYAQLAMLLIDDPLQPIRDALDTSFSILSNHPLFSAPDLYAALWHIRGYRELPAGTGYCVDTLYSAVWAMEQGSDYLSVVRAAISLGNDTDTTACVAGGLSGIVYEISGKAEEWLLRLTTSRESQQLLREVFSAT